MRAALLHTNLDSGYRTGRDTTRGQEKARGPPALENERAAFTVLHSVGCRGPRPEARAPWRQGRQGPRPGDFVGAVHLLRGTAPIPRRARSISHLTESVCEVVLKKLIPAQICQLIIYISNNERQLTDLCGN